MTLEVTSKDTLKAHPVFLEWMNKHVHHTQYTFQIKNCGKGGEEGDLARECKTCGVPKLSASEFRCLSWLPEPELDIANPGHYKPFHEVYRNAQPNPNQFVPSLLLGPDNVDGRGTFKIANLEGKILCTICTNCQKPRCVFFF